MGSLEALRWTMIYAKSRTLVRRCNQARSVTGSSKATKYNIKGGGLCYSV